MYSLPTSCIPVFYVRAQKSLHGGNVQARLWPIVMDQTRRLGSSRPPMSLLNYAVPQRQSNLRTSAANRSKTPFFELKYTLLVMTIKQLELFVYNKS